MWEEFGMGIICVYFLVIVCLLGGSSPWGICLQATDDRCCCMVWWTLLLIGVPSSFVWFHILIFRNWPNQTPLFIWLLLTCIFGTVSILRCECDNIWLRVPSIALVIQNNILLLVPTIALIVCTLRPPQGQLEQHDHDDHEVYRIMETPEEDSDWQRI